MRCVLGHVDCPDAGPAAQVENAGRPVLRNRGLVQVSSPCDEEQLVVYVHAVLFGLVARVHVEAASEAVVEAAILLVRLRSGNNRAGRDWVSAGRLGEGRVARSGVESTHPLEAIVTIGAALVRIQDGSSQAATGGDKAGGGEGDGGRTLSVASRWS